MKVSERATLLANQGQVQEAYRLLSEELALGSSEAGLTLGRWRIAGNFIRRDIDAACDMFEQSAALGSREAEEAWIALQGHGYGQRQRDWQAALARLRERGIVESDAAQHARLLAAMDCDPNGNPVEHFTPEFLSSEPLVVRFGSFLSSEECDALISLARPHLSPSVDVEPKTGKMIADPVRTSSSAAFGLLDEGPFLHAINRRIAKASRSDVEQGEPTQILSYAGGQEYKAHFDALPREANQRIQTFLVYLNDGFQGGETLFVKSGLKIVPRKGDAICFSNVRSDMTPEPYSLHAGMPVTRGEKLILSRWIRRFPLDLTGPSGRPC